MDLIKRKPSTFNASMECITSKSERVRSGSLMGQCFNQPQPRLDV